MRPIRPLVAAIAALTLVSLPIQAQETPSTTAQELMVEAQQLSQSGEWDRAIDAWKRVTELVPSEPFAAFQYAYALHMAKRFDEAIPAHQRAAEFDSNRAVALYNLACAYALTGRDEQAFDALDDAIDAGFSAPETIRNDADLTLIRATPRFEQLVRRVPTAPLPPKHRELLFWVGEWDVYNKAGTRVGHNSITLTDNGFAIHESWTSTNGSTGRSVNYLHPTTGQWNQLWVSSAGHVLEMSGTFTDGAMRLTGKRVDQQGNEFEHRTTLTPLDGGRVRQFIEESPDGGATWQVPFDAVYVPRGAPAPGAWADEIDG